MLWQQAYAIQASIDRERGRGREIDRYLLNQSRTNAELIHGVITLNQFSFLC